MKVPAFIGQVPRKKRTRGCSQFIEPNAPQTMAVASAPNYMLRVPEPRPMWPVACGLNRSSPCSGTCSGSGGEKAWMLVFARIVALYLDFYEYDSATWERIQAIVCGFH